MSTFTFVLIGKAISAATFAIASLLPGSLVLGGNLFFDTVNNTAPQIYQDGTSVDGVPYIKACTGTGGQSVYDTCIIPPLLSSSGTIKRIDLMVTSNPAGASLDCGFVKGTNTATGTLFTNFDSVASATGSRVTFSTGSLSWNSADYIKCATLTDPTSSFDADIRVEYFDDTSE